MEFPISPLSLGILAYIFLHSVRLHGIPLFYRIEVFINFKLLPWKSSRPWNASFSYKKTNGEHGLDLVKVSMPAVHRRSPPVAGFPTSALLLEGCESCTSSVFYYCQAQHFLMLLDCNHGFRQWPLLLSRYEEVLGTVTDLDHLVELEVFGFPSI